MRRNPKALERYACIAFTNSTPTPGHWTYREGGGKETRVAVRPHVVVNTGQAAVTGRGLVRAYAYQVAGLVVARKLRTVVSSAGPAPVVAQLVPLPGLRPRVVDAFVGHAVPELTQRLQRLRLTR